jgi:hypothetical protein
MTESVAIARPASAAGRWSRADAIVSGMSASRAPAAHGR